MQLVSERVKPRPETPTNRRLAWCRRCSTRLGCAARSSLTLKAGNLAWKQFDADTGGWMLNVLGKGMKLRPVPVPDPVTALMQD